MAWTIIIGEGSQTFTISTGPEEAKFEIEGRASYNDAGQPDATEIFIEIEGDIVAATPSLVTDSFVSHLAELRTKQQPRRVQLKLDGVTKFDFIPSQCVSSPVVTRLASVADPGNAENHWRYRMSIYVKTGGTFNAHGGVVSFVGKIGTVERRGTIIHKTWTVSLQSGTLAGALAAAKAFRPSQFDQEEIERDQSNKRVTIQWTWEAQGADFIEIIEQPIIVTGAGKDVVEDPQVAGALPKLHRARKRAAIVEVRGIVRGYDRAKLKPPSPHFGQQAGKMERLVARENRGLVAIEDARLKTFVLPYHEVWIAAIDDPGDIVASAKHAGHDAPAFVSPPADGPLSL